VANKSNQSWLDRHLNDAYVKQSQKDGYRSRAAYKLLEIHKKDKIFRPGIRVVDLGAAPGSWSQIAVREVGRKGEVIAVDLLPMQPIDGVRILQGDFLDETLQAELAAINKGQPLDLVISDLAPNITGDKSVDQPRVIGLVEAVLLFSKEHLKAGGSMLVKIFQGDGFDLYVKEVRQSFERVVIRKPDASRSESREVYVLARNYKL